MNSEQCTFLLGQAADSMPTLSSGINQSLPSSKTPTPAQSSEVEPKTDGSQDCTCGKAMSECSIHLSMREKWIAFMRDSLAQIFQSVEKEKELPEANLAYTPKSSEYLASFDPVSSSWKIHQRSLIEGLDWSLEIWPRSGMTRNGHVYLLPALVPQLFGTDGGHFPSPRTSMWKNRKWYFRKKLMGNLEELPGLKPEKFAWLAGKPINPAWCEWLMMWPITATVLSASETDKFRFARQRHGKF